MGAHAKIASILLATLLTGARICAQMGADPRVEQIGALIDAGRLDEAVDEAGRAAQQYPQSAAIQQVRGEALFKKGLNPEARQAFRRAIELAPKDPRNHFNLALVELAEDQYAAAAQSLEASLRLDPANAQARVLLGRSYHNLNRTGPAIEQFQKALALSPRLPLAHYHLGYVYQGQGNSAAALEEYTREMKLNPGFVEPYIRAGEIQLGKGNLAEAGVLFQDAINLRPRSVEARYGMARVLLGQKNLADAASSLERVIELKADHVQAHYALARAYQQLGRKEDAEREFKIVSELHARSSQRSPGIAGSQNP